MIQLRLPLFVVSLLSGAFAPVPAQTQAAADVNRMYAPVPFGPGERMTYKVTLGVFGEVGNGSIEVEDQDTVHGFPSYRLRMRIKGGIPFMHVDNIYQSWLDTQSLIARRFKTDVKEVNYKRKRTFEFFPAERLWRRTDKNESGPMPTSEPLDDLSFLYFARTLPLTVGETYTLPRYFKVDGNPVTLKVLRKDSVTVKLGTFRTIVVQPIIRTDGLFSQGGNAEVYFTDDDRRIPVYIKTGISKIPLLKTIKMSLDHYTPGTRLSPSFSPRSSMPQ